MLTPPGFFYGILILIAMLIAGLVVAAFGWRIARGVFNFAYNVSHGVNTGVPAGSPWRIGQWIFLAILEGLVLLFVLNAGMAIASHTPGSIISSGWNLGQRATIAVSTLGGDPTLLVDPAPLPGPAASAKLSGDTRIHNTLKRMSVNMVDPNGKAIKGTEWVFEADQGETLIQNNSVVIPEHQGRYVSISNPIGSGVIIHVKYRGADGKVYSADIHENEQIGRAHV